MLIIKELVTVNWLVRSMFKQMGYKQVKNLFKHIYIKRTSHEMYIDCSLQLASFSKNNCSHKSDDYA